MKKIFSLLIIFCVSNGIMVAQDTITMYYSKNWKLANGKDDAAYYRKIFQGPENIWLAHDFYISDKILMTGAFKTKSLDFKHGFFTFYYENGNKKIEGNYVNNKLEGDWKYWFENGQKKSEGAYLNDNKVGEWNYWDEYGHIQTREVYKKRGVCSSEGFYFNGAKKYTGTYINEKQEGLWTYFNEIGRVTTTGNFKNGLREGEWKRYFRNGEEIVRYRDGEMLGSPIGGMVRND